ncbi:MAG: GAF domain-containing protein [Candidatus Marinimicrobia bacterium]|nr:GAF domain-containing protein [Candidatus Neomarinimicrobiota bacterium]
MKKSDDLQQLILHISTDFINLVPGEVDNKIHEALKQIGEFTGSDRSYVFLLNRSLNTMTNTHGWCAAGIEPKIANLKSLKFDKRQWFWEKLFKKEIIEIDDIHSSPDWATLEKEEFQAQGIQSLVVAPMVYSKDPIGFVGFDSVLRRRHWSANEISLLKTVADIFTNTIIHWSLVNKLHDSEEQYRLLVENLNDGIVISQNDKFTFINKQFAGLNRIDHKSLQVANLYSAYLLLDRYKVKICVENKLDKSTSFYLKIPVNG